MSRRQASHQVANESAGDAPPSCVASIPLVPQGAPIMIDRPEALPPVMEAIRATGTFAFDTEFIGETSYDARICLVQVATPQEVWLIDPLSGVDIQPVWELVADPSVRTLVHAGIQDLEPVARGLGRPPRAITDTQIAAGFCGLPHPLSLRDLAAHTIDVRLGKAYTFTRWDVRPLPRQHRAYAADDVRYLHAIDAQLAKAMEGSPSERWARAASADFEEMNRYGFDLDSRVRKIAGGRSLPGRALAALEGFVRLREEMAKTEDLPPRSVMRDEVVLRAARDLPRSEAQFVAIKGMPRPIVQRWGARLLAVVEHVSALAPSELPVPELPEESVDDRARIDALYALVQAWCHGHGIDPSLVASRRDVMVWYMRSTSGADPGLSGWRREFIGEPLERFLRGRSAFRLAMDHGRLRASAEQTQQEG